jgi:transcriptional regulator CtsR
MGKQTKVYIIESERGWGQKIDEIKKFESEEEADKFIKKFNSKNDKNIVPDWYMYATKEKPPFL